MNGNKKFFPIVNQSACVHKWAWNTFRLADAKSSSCHRVTPVTVSIDNFENFHNLPEIIEDRKLMLEGKWPERKGCDYCRVVEEAGGVSDRMYQNSIPGQTPIDFDVDNLNVTPTISEIYLRNTCDLACVYCLPRYSSRINQELIKFGINPNIKQMVPIVEISNRDDYFEAYLNWLDKNHNKLTRLSVLGGEPLLQKELWLMLDRIESYQSTNLELSINTNLNSDISKVEQLVYRIRSMLIKKNLKKFSVNASIDNWNEQASFIRSGLNLDVWLKNFSFLSKQKWISLSVHHVVTSLSIDYIQPLQDIVADFKKDNKKILQSYHTVDSGFEQIYSPTFFGPDFFKKSLNKLIETYPTVTPWDAVSKERLVGIVKLIEASTVDKEGLTKLKSTLDLIDVRRNTNWKHLFPRIDQFFKENNI